MVLEHFACILFKELKNKMHASSLKAMLTTKLSITGVWNIKQGKDSSERMTQVPGDVICLWEALLVGLLAL